MSTTETQPYVARPCYDADSHLMELPDWLESYADPGVRERLRPLHLGGAGRMAERAVRDAAARRDDPARARDAEADLLTAKGWGALGAFDPAERSRALDLLGFDSQLVFSTFAPTQFLGEEAEVVLGGLRAHNRAMVDFCSDDPRLVPVAQAFWTGPESTLATVIEALDMGAGAVLFPSHPGRGVSPTHPDHDAVWSVLEERGVPFLSHIGGGGRTLKPAFHDNGRPVSDFLGGGENVRAKDYMVIHQQPEQFFSALVLDGVLEAHPGLQGGCIEQGAMWVVPWLRRIDLCQATFGRHEETLRDLPERPSDYVRRQVTFTPFPGEDVGWLIDECGADLFLFSSDYPHPEGTKDPVARFEKTMEGVSDLDRDKFYADNYKRLMGIDG